MPKKSRIPKKNQSFWWIVSGGIVVAIGIVMISLLQPGTQVAEPDIAMQPTATSTPIPEPEPTVTQTSTAMPEPEVSTPVPATATSEPSTPIYNYEIINTFPHDPEAFTQGLIYLDDILYEGTGLKGFSTIRKVDLETGEVLQFANIDAQFFGEGITVFEDKLYQLTWQAQKGFVYDKETFTLEREFTYPTQGWGLTHDGQHLIMSDGTANLYFLDPQTLTEVRRVTVQDGNNVITQLNELEYVNGQVYANVWKTDFIVMIDPEDGNVLGWLNLSNILGPEDRVQRVDVLNGIAYDQAGDRLFVTGKWWPKLFEIKIVPNP